MQAIFYPHPGLATITLALREQTMIKSVQYLRAIAALMVVMHHVVIKGRQYDIPSLSWFHIGYYGVDLFFYHISLYHVYHHRAKRGNVWTFHLCPMHAYTSSLLADDGRGAGHFHHQTERG